MKILFLIAISSAFSCFGGTQSVTFNGWAAQSPVTSGLTSVGDIRMTIRVHGINTTGAGIKYLATHWFWEALRANTTDSTIINFSNSISYSGRTDFIIRAQRCASTDMHTLEIWNADGSNYAQSTYSASLSPADWSANRFYAGYSGEVGIDAKLAYFRVSSGCVALGTAPGVDGDIARWEFEGDLTDTSGVTGTLSTTAGTPAYTTTPVVAPTSSVDNPFPTRTGAALTLVGSAWHPESTATCRWNIVAGPQYLPAVRIADNTACSTTATGTTIAGDYTFRFTASVSSASTSTDVHRGVVATDSNGVVIPPPTLSSAFKEMVGDVTRLGTAPWSYYDHADMANADRMLATVTAPTSGTTALAGTVTLSPCCGDPGELNPIEVAGTGTAFTSDFVGGGIIWLWCSFPDQPVADGRFLAGITTVVSNTRMILAPFYHIVPAGSCTNVQYSKPDPFDLAPWGYGAPIDTWNFYDAVLAMYRTWLRTGKDEYLTGARFMADTHWKYAYDSGYHLRMLWIFRSIYGSALRAEDGHSEWWNAIATPLAIGSDVDNFSSPVAQGTHVEARDYGYQLGAMAVVAKYHPDSGTRTTHCAYVKSAINNYFSPAQLANGSWFNDVYGGNASYPYLGEGTFTWHHGVMLKGLKFAYLAMLACGETATAATTLTVMENIAEYVYSGGRAPDRKTHYDTGYIALGQNRPVEAGTVSGSNGGTTITGVGTNFQTAFLCNGTDYIAVDSNRNIRLVSSCASQTSMTIATGLSSAVSDATYRRSLPPDTGAACDPSTENFCELSQADRSLTRLIVGHYGWLYHLTGTLKWKTYGDELFSSTFGGPASGPGYNDACAGLNCDDSYSTDFIGILPTCVASPPPCGGVGSGYGKNWAMGSGTGAAQNHLAYRVGGLAPEDLRTYSYYFTLPSGADKIQLTVIRPNGTTVSPSSCTTSPCSFTYDARQGTHMVRHEFQTTGGTSRGVSDYRAIN